MLFVNYVIRSENKFLFESDWIATLSLGGLINRSQSILMADVPNDWPNENRVVSGESVNPGSSLACLPDCFVILADW